MEYLKVDPKFSRRPKCKRAGWHAREVHGFLTRLSAEYDWYGFIPVDYQEAEWLAEEWTNGDAAALPHARVLLETGLEAAFRGGLLTLEADGRWGLYAWEEFYKARARTGAERQAEYEAREKAKKKASRQAEDKTSEPSDLTEERQDRQTRHSDATPLHTTPHDLDTYAEEGGAGGSASAPPPEPPAPEVFVLELAGEGSAGDASDVVPPPRKAPLPSEPPPEGAKKATKARKAAPDRAEEAALEEVRNGCAEDFCAAKRVPYGRPDTDMPALRGMRKKPGGGPEEIRRRWGLALGHKGFPKVSTLRQLEKFWDDFAEAPEVGRAPAATPRNPALQVGGRTGGEVSSPCEWQECGEETVLRTWGRPACSLHYETATEAWHQAWKARQKANGVRA